MLKILHFLREVSTQNKLIIGHFSKRCLETLYIHKYSGFMSLPTVIAICCFYSMFSFTIGYYLTNRIKGIEDHGPVIESMEFVIGLFLYCIQCIECQ